MLHPSYFEMVSSLWFETYFRVSKHLGCPISEVIRKKFSADYRVLIMRYHMEITNEIKEAERIKEESKKYKR